MLKQIFCLDMDTFFVSVERIFQPSLIGKPVIVGGEPNTRGVVSAASYEAREYGIHSGMSLYMAYQKCPNAIFLKPNFTAYAKYSKLVYFLLIKYIPIIEQASVDEFYGDLTGCERLHGNLFNLLAKIKKEINQELNLPASIGFGTNKHIAKIASKLAKPNRVLKIESGSERIFLAPLDIKYLQGAGEKTQKILSEFGINTIGQLADLPESLVMKKFGKLGYSLFLKAKGFGDEEFISDKQRKSISKEETFLVDISDIKFLKKRLGFLLTKICFELRKENFKASLVIVKIRYSNFQTKTKQKKISLSNSEHEIYPTVINLFTDLYKAKINLRLIGVTLSNLTKEEIAPLFYENSNHKKKAELYSAIDKIKNKFGNKSINWIF